MKLLKSLVYKQTCFPKEINNSVSYLLSAMNSWSSCAIKKSWPLQLYVSPFFFFVTAPFLVLEELVSLNAQDQPS